MIYMSDLDWVGLVTFGWLLFWAVLSANNLMFKQYQSIYIVIIFHFLFLGIPLLLDVAFGQANFDNFPGLQPAVKDQTTFWIYCLYVSIAPVIWWYTGKTRKAKELSPFSVESNINILSSSMPVNTNYGLVGSGKKVKLFAMILCYLILYLPTILWFFSPDPSVYFTYGAVVNGFYSDALLEYHRLIHQANYLSLLGISGIILLKKKLSFLNLFFWITLMMPLGITIWLNGKRGIIAYILSSLLMSLMIRKNVKKSLQRTKIMILLFLMVTLFISFSYYYQTSLVRSVTSEQLYDNYRRDYTMEHQLKFSIYSELNPDKIKILDYKFQTIYLQTIQFVPRFLWSNKPNIVNHDVLLTTSALKIPVNNFVFGIKSLWLAEALSNFGWIAIFVGPLMLSILCRTGDGTNKKFIKLLTSLIALRLTIGYLTLINTSLLIIWVIFVLRCKYFKKIKGKAYPMI